MTNLVSHLAEVVRDHPEAAALSIPDDETTYGELWALAGEFAAGLVERGIRPGDAVALYLPNLPQFVTAYQGILRAGGVVVPVNPRHGADELREPLADSGAAAAVTTTDRIDDIEAVYADTDLEFVVTADGTGQFSIGFAEFVDTDADFDFWERAAREDDDVAALAYTSGTTGEPKGVELTHGNLVSNARTMADLVPGGVGPGVAALAALPLYHAYGMTVMMNATLLRGGVLHPMARWDPGRALELLAGPIDVFHGVPTMYRDLLAEADGGELSSLRLAGVGGSDVPLALHERVEDELGADLQEGYGLTEASPVTHFNTPERGRRVGSVGRPLPDVEARVVGEGFEERPPVEAGPVETETLAEADAAGEIVVAGPNVMRGYHGRPEATAEAITEHDGRRFLHTGDVGYRDEDGYFYVLDRLADVVSVAGRDVYPGEVESALAEHPAVAEAAVVGVPDERRGAAVAAFVVTAADASADADALDEHCRDRLADHERPRLFEFVESLPRTATGTVRRGELRERLDPADLEAVPPESGADGDGDERGRADARDGAGDGDDGGPGTGESGDRGTGDGAASGPEELEDIAGVGPSKSEQLRAAGFETVEDVVAATREELAEADGVGDALADQIKEDVGD